MKKRTAVNLFFYCLFGLIVFGEGFFIFGSKKFRDFMEMLEQYGFGVLSVQDGPFVVSMILLHTFLFAGAFLLFDVFKSSLVKELQN